MGFSLSKPPLHLTSVLISLEQQITHLNKQIHSLESNKSTFSFRFIIFFIITVPLSFFHTFYNNSLSFFLYLPSIILLKMICSYFYTRKLRILGIKVDALKEKQKKNIEILKKERRFNEAKEIIERYEKSDKNGKREKVFVERLADMVLGEVENCYALICKNCKVHNGLRREDEELEGFVCYKCEYMNVYGGRNNGSRNI